MITRSSSVAMDEENSTSMLLFPTSSPWNSISVFTKTAQEKGMDAETWGFHISSALGAAGVEMPSPELADVLVSHICWDNNVPAAWKYLNKAISCGIAPSVLVIALLSTRVYLNRQKRPTAYRLYMEILKRHYFSLVSQFNDSNSKRILILVDDVLHLSKRFGVEACQPGVFNVVYIFYIIWQLVDAILEDEGLTDFSLGRLPRWINSPQDMEIDRIVHFNESRHEYNEKAFITNTTLGIELIGQFLHHKVISRLLYLASQNMPPHWKIFSKYLHLLAAKSFALQSSTMLSPTFMHSSLDNLIKASWQYKPSQYSKFCAISSGSGSLASPGSHCQGFSCSAIWVPLDLYLEDAIDGSVAATNAIEIISGLLKALQAVNRTSWHEAFLGLWIAALRLVQRERDPIEGPVPHEDTRMCILLSVTTLSIASVIKEDECITNGQTEIDSTKQSNETSIEGTRRKALVSSLQILGDYKSLLVPPPSFISVASQAAAKAIAFVSGNSVPNGYCEGAGMNNKFNCSGDMRHLIVEACIARNLLDTSAYYWPGYLFGPINQLPCIMSGQELGWSELMMGAELTSSMRKALVNAPASSLAELEKVFEISVNGSSDDKISAAMILSGASLIRGWNIQEFTVRFVIKLLSPPVPTEYSGSESHLISHAPVLDALLAGISSVDCVQVFSFHGLVPELAGALMVICEVFGSCIPNATWTLPTGEVSAHTVFSNAFILLLRLWEFNHTPLEYILMGDGAPVGSQLTPEYLLLLRNSQVLSSVDIIKNWNSDKSLSSDEDSVDLVFMDSFLKLKVWYRQHQACLASTLSGLIPGSPVYQNVNSLLHMMFKKLSKGTTQSLGSVTSENSSFSSSSISGSEDTTLRPRLPAWDIMEAAPYVVDAALTACAHGRLSPRELATGLKDLADFLPASLATIVSYFSAEVTRGVWRHANMNGTDWPSPAANLSTVGENIKKIVSSTGADVPSLVEAGQATLPLPLAAFVSHTITYKLDRDSERFLNLAGPALENLAASCPWPSMPIVAALWTQKVKRWSDFLTFSASRTIFHNNDALVHLLRSCFSAVLGLNASPGSAGGVGSLLGHGFSSDHSGGLSPVAPGILYLRSYRSTKDAMFLTEEILSLLMLSVREVMSECISNETREKLTKSKYGTKYCQVSPSTAFTRVKTASSLGATLMWLSGGCGLIQCMFREILPSWFISFHHSKQGSQGDMVAMLEGYALAYFAMLSGMFGWGIDKVPLWRRRPKVIAVHLEFLTDVLDGKVSLGCSLETWRAYFSAFLGLMVECAPNWLLEIDLALLKRLSMGLRQWNEEDLALLLLERSGPRAMGAAAELIISSQ